MTELTDLATVLLWVTVSAAPNEVKEAANRLRDNLKKDRASCEWCDLTSIVPGQRADTVLAYEGHITKDRRLLELGSCWWDEKRFPLPVIQSDEGSYEHRVWGHITHLTRVNGEIRATVDRELPAGFVLSMSGTGDIVVGDDDLVVFPRYQVLGAHLMTADTWVWADQIDG